VSRPSEGCIQTGPEVEAWMKRVSIGANAAGLVYRVENITRRDGGNVKARIFTPKSAALDCDALPRAAVVLAYGGAFSCAMPELRDRLATSTASWLSGDGDGGNMVVIVPEFRQGVENPHSTCRGMEDLEDAVAFARGSYPHLSVGLAGRSSGGFFAMEVGRRLAAAGCPPKFVIALCPVANPGMRAEYLAACIRGEGTHWLMRGFPQCGSPPLDAQVASVLLEQQTGHFSSMEEMHAAGTQLEEFIEDAPPTLLVYSMKDSQVPFQVVQGVRQWADEEVAVEEAGHGEISNGGVPIVNAQVEQFLVKWL